MKAQTLSSQTESLIQKIQSFLVFQPVEKAYLFGSFSRGEANAQSDIDLLVKLDFTQIKTGLEFFVLWEELEKLTGRKIDLVSEGKLSKYVAPRVEQEKILIYEKAEA